MGYDKFVFTGYAKCPCCQAGMIMIDNKVVSCPVCELKREEKAQKLGKGTPVSQAILI